MHECDDRAAGDETGFASHVAKLHLSFFQRCVYFRIEPFLA